MNVVVLQPPHASRVAALNIPEGTGMVNSSLKFLREHNGFSHRVDVWPQLFQFPASHESLYRQRLSRIFQQCEGCERLLPSHIFSPFSSIDAFLGSTTSSSEEEESWTSTLFRTHNISDPAQQRSVLRVLLVLEIELDLEHSVNLVDLVCLFFLYLNEAQVFAAISNWVVLNSLQFTRHVSTPQQIRRLLCVTSHVSSNRLAHLLLGQIRHPGLHARLIPHVKEIQSWFDRWLVPILPLNQVVCKLMDGLVAGDDLKLMLRLCCTAVWACKSELLRDSKGNITDIIASKQQPQKVKLYSVQKRRFLQQWCNRHQAKEESGVQTGKIRCAHVNRTVVKTSSIFNGSFDAFHTLISFLPSQVSPGVFHMQRIFDFTESSMRNFPLTDLYAACVSKTFLGNAFLLVVSSQRVMEPNVLPTVQLQNNERCVFGVFSPVPFCLSSRSCCAGCPCFVFQLEPQLHRWTTSIFSLDDVMRCTKNELCFGQALCFRDNDLSKGSSSPCDVFQSEVLCCCPGRGKGTYYFKTTAMEVFALGNV